MMGHIRGLHTITFYLLVIGGLNWLSQAIFSWELGDLFGGMHAPISRIIYILVGLAALYEVFTHGQRCRECKPEMGKQPTAGM